MPLIDLIPIGSTRTCSINSEGTINFPQQVLHRLGWRVPSKIAVTYIDNPLTILLRIVDGEEAGFTFSYQNRSSSVGSGGKITCSKFAKQVLRLRVVLPLRNLPPIFPKGTKYQLALLVQEPVWAYEEFTQVGYQHIPSDIKGVYQLLSSAGNILRIGEGAISSRIKEHLSDDRFSSKVRTIRYLKLSDKAETATMEKILLAQHENETGELPLLNKIRA